MKYTIFVGKKPLSLEHCDLDENIDVDKLTTIDTSNIFGEAITISASTNQFGMLKSDIESKLSLLKLEIRLLENGIKKRKRIEAANNSGCFYLFDDETEENVKIKATEKALETCFEDNEEWIAKKKEVIEFEKKFSILTSLYWSMQDKCRKLNGLVSSTTPEEFVEEMVEGKINGILVEKK